MSETTYDVVGIGNAIVDVIANVDEKFLEVNELAKGAMTIIDADQAEVLYEKMGSGIETSGGSAANTIAALASLGGSGAYIGNIHDDQLGKVFRHGIRAAGVSFNTPAASSGAPTARCLIFVTPDAQRTMQTFLGACVDLGPESVDTDLVANSDVVYLEGYLWDPPRAKEAFIKAAEAAKAAGRKVSLSLSDPFCVDRHREEFINLVDSHVNLLFANEDEIKSLYQVEDFKDALRQVCGHCDVAALTRGERGSVLVSGGEVQVIDAAKVDRVVDTTGAGDAYAAGLLFGYTRGYDLATCGRLGSVAAAEVISHYGARPEKPLNTLAAKVLAG